MTPRMNYKAHSAELLSSLLIFSGAIKKESVIEETIRSLVDIRASQINGCAFCLDMHIKQAKIRGESELRLYHVAIWRESLLFTDRERAALGWTEALTHLGPHGVADADYDAARAQLSEKELSDLTFSVITINAWNRLSIAFRNPPGSQDKAFGLDKAGLN